MWPDSNTGVLTKLYLLSLEKALELNCVTILWQGYLHSWDAHIHCLIIWNNQKNADINCLSFFFFSLLDGTLPICAYPESGLGALFVYLLRFLTCSTQSVL